MTEEYCPICERLTRRLLCNCCINVHFAYSSKKARLLDHLTLLDSLASQYEVGLTERDNDWENIAVELAKARPRLQLLRRARTVMTKKVELKRRRLKNLVNEIAYRSEVVAHLESVCQKCSWQNDEKRSEVIERHLEFDNHQAKLMARRHELVKQMFDKVFPIKHVSNELRNEYKDERGDQPSSSGVCEALSEAAAVHYCFDRWILMDEVAKAQFLLVDHCMATDYSDYALLKQFLFNAKADATSAGSTLFAINKCAFGSCPSLTYASQLCSLLSRVLDFHIPFVVEPGDFCVENICQDEFETAVLKFNANVAVLHSGHCAQLAQPVSLSRPFVALINLRTLCDSSFSHPFAMPIELLAEFQSALADVNWCEKKTPQEEARQSEWDDWESVSDALPEWNDSTGSTLTQIINSATSSVASFLKAMQL